ncbi:SIMPL domain-containing protein [Flavobacterium rakeshii]|uniref:SIMPL domain-containing protein n=1 Tax=Flavobacterium rakeshii TaxID=1038845 RepID=UPI002E7BDB6A|nr:SIMPL domain-containing protein [Flavobacterium rakeshii]MEE1900039.1 SIMPL domain-containing protein [Flavobacterium rakeshii]
MKKFAIVLVMMIAGAANAQQAPVPQVTVQGEGIIKVTPDMATITIGVNNEGNDAKEVKKENDKATDAVIKYLKKAGIDAKDYQTERVYLNRNYDYDKKKYYYKASQTISVKLKDLSKYDDLITGLTEAGVNNIQGVNFESSKQKEYEAQARREAMLDAQKKAKEYASALGQGIGSAIMINESGSSYTPPMRMAMAMNAEMDSMGSRETLAVGEIEVRAKVTVSFVLSN